MITYITTDPLHKSSDPPDIRQLPASTCLGIDRSKLWNKDLSNISYVQKG